MVLPTHPSARLALDAVRHVVLHSQPLPCPPNLDDALKQPMAVFVSIKNGGALRGCIGNLVPTRDSLAEEIIHYAGQAARHDPRFSPVASEELSGLTVSVDVLSPLSPVEEIAHWDTRVYGLVVSAGEKQGVLLPDQPGISRPGDQLQACLKKAGIRPGEAYEMFNFTSRRYQSAAS